MDSQQVVSDNQSDAPVAVDSMSNTSSEGQDKREPDSEVFHECDASNAPPFLTSTLQDDSSSDTSPPLDAGEKSILLKSLEDDDNFYDEAFEFADSGMDSITTNGRTVTNLQSDFLYRHPLSVPEAAAMFPEGGDTGLIWHATIIPNEFFTRFGRLKGGLPRRDLDVDNQTVKLLRPSLPVMARDFFPSLTEIPGPRWIFHGVLNGWPSLTCLELISLEQRRHLGWFASPKDLVTGQLVWVHQWDVDREGRKGVAPSLGTNDQNHVYRAKLRGAPWTAIGWSKESPGFVFWYEGQHPETPKLTYGTNMIHSLGDDICTYVHMVSHRYAVQRETPKDMLTYHSIVLLEWDHGKYCTVVEGAYLNGMSGYKGKCNWYHDKNETVTQLYRAFPPEMVAPWLTSAAEIRCYDIQAKNLEELKDFMKQYEGNTQRFVDPHFSFSHRARLTYRSKRNIAQYLLNYTLRDCSYSELKRNCQTFAADLCCFLAGKKGVEPFHPVNRIDYRNRSHLFLYESHMYERTRTASTNKKR